MQYTIFTSKSSMGYSIHEDTIFTLTPIYIYRQSVKCCRMSVSSTGTLKENKTGKDIEYDKRMDWQLKIILNNYDPRI